MPPAAPGFCSPSLLTPQERVPHFPGVAVTWIASYLSWLGAPSTTVFEQGVQPTDLRKPIVGELYPNSSG